jgi:hypothetical protein
MATSNAARSPALRLRAPRARRAIAGLVAAVACVMGLQAIAADRADAACYDVGGSTSISYWCDIYGSPYYSGGGGGGGGGDAGGLAEVGIGDEGYGGGGFPPGKSNFGSLVASLVDNVLVNNEPCRNLVTGTAPRYSQNALEVWNAVEITRAAAPNSDSSTANADAHFNQGSNGTITIYPPYYFQKGTDVFGYIPPHTGISRFPTDIEMQARTALHELAHLTGALPPEATPGASREFNMRILETCFGIQRYSV